MRRPSAVFRFIAHRSENIALLERIAFVPSSNAVPTQMTVENPEGLHLVPKRPSDLNRKTEGVFGDERGAVGAVLIVERNVLNHTVTKGVNRGSHRSSQVQANVMVAHATKEFGGVHRWPAFIVPTH